MEAQYDRFIAQLREEVKELYWLYNFFFALNSAALGAFFLGKINQNECAVPIIGIFISLYWAWITNKQRLWRDDWIKKIKIIEVKLGYQEEFRMWRDIESESFSKNLHELFLGKRLIWRALLILPVLFCIAWIGLLF